MRALKCDRCGALYEEPYAIPDIRIHKYKHHYGEERLDLCDNCQKKLEDWLVSPSKKEVDDAE